MAVLSKESGEAFRFPRDGKPVPYEGIEGAVGGRFVNRPYEVSSKTRVILSEATKERSRRIYALSSLQSSY